MDIKTRLFFFIESFVVPTLIIVTMAFAISAFVNFTFGYR